MFVKIYMNKSVCNILNKYFDLFTHFYRTHTNIFFFLGNKICISILSLSFIFLSDQHTDTSNSIL